MPNYDFTHSWQRDHERDQPERKPVRLFDWEREEVFEGYDPERDGFAYPVPERIEEPDFATEADREWGTENPDECNCTQDPGDPHSAVMCERCFTLLLVEWYR